MRAPARAALAMLVALTAAGDRARAEVTEGSTGPSVVTAPAAVTFTPLLLLQADGVVARHGSAPLIEDGIARPGVYLRRARLGADALAGVWRARLVFEAAAGGTFGFGQAVLWSGPLPSDALDPIAGDLGGGAPRTTEAFVALAPHKAFSLSAGVLRVPIGLSRQVSEANLRLPERARIITRATPDFRAGAAAAGDLGLLQYSLGAYSRPPDLGYDFPNGGALYVLRLGAEPVGPVGLAPQLRRREDPWYGWWRFAVGLSAFYATLPGANELGVGGDGQFQWRRLLVTGEVLWTRRNSNDRVGFYVEPGVFVWAERLELVARVEWFNDRTGPRTPADAWGAALGATFFSWSRIARVQAAYTVRRSPADERAVGWAMLRATFVVE